MKKILSYTYLSFLLLLLSTMVYHPSVIATDEDELVIEINRGVVRPVTLAVANFKSENLQLGKDINNVMANNFRLSGHLNTLKPKDMPNQPFRSNQIIYSAWDKQDAEYIVFGEITKAGRNKYQMNISVADVLSKKIRDSKIFKFKKKYTRDFAHYISDYVYKQITGLDGSFSTKIAYVKRTTVRNKKRYQLIIADADGARERTIVTSDEPLSSPAWSPDASKIAYVSFEYGYPYIFVQDIKKGKRKVITNYRGINSSPSWSPDGKTLAVVLSQGANADVFLIDLEEKSYTRVTSNSEIDTEPSWSKDGSKLLFTSDRTGRPQIYEYDIKSGSIKHLIRNNSYSARASYTHNNKDVVMINIVSRRYAVVLYNLASGKVTQISKTGLDDSPSVSPDGNRVIYSTKIGSRNRLAIASVDLGNGVYLNSERGDITSVAWSPFIFKFSF